MTTSTKSFLGDPKKVFLLAALSVFVGHRLLESFPSSGWAWPVWVSPAAPKVLLESLTPAEKTLWQTVATLRLDERAALAEYHSSLARAVAADPASEPVIKDTPAFRRAYRAGLLFVWTGVAGQPAGQNPDLSAALDGVLTAAVGKEEVPVNPAIRKSLVDCLNRIAAVCTSARQ